jgi:acetyl esterase/lipase
MRTHLCAIMLLACVSTTARSAEPQVVPLWPAGAPGFEDRRDEPEQAQDYWVKNIHNPSLTVFPPSQETATGAAIIVCPGGGHRELVFNAEGREAAEFLNGLGVAVFVLKYRLAREAGSPYKLDEHVPQDAHRAVRLVRSRAAKWGVDPKRVGMLGFSAGGEVVSLIAYEPAPGDSSADDPVEREAGRPDFQILIYPGPLGIPETVPADAPPALLIVANDDRGHVEPVVDLLSKYRAARAPVEVHIFAHGGHAFNMGNRSELKTLRNWPGRMADWLADNRILAAK